LDVGGRLLVFRRAVIAAGSHAVLPPIPGLRLVPFLTHETIFDLLACPEHLLVLGGGPIGLEMALAHRRLGARVTLVEQAQIASREDPECVDVLRAALAAEGVELREGLGVAELAPAPGGLLARLTDGTTIKASHLLVAAGLQQIRRCVRGAIGASGWRGILLTLKGLARVPLPMWRLSMPGSSPGPCCFACLQSWITRRCRA
jgi:pyruvate/2-oxoglutarate dehydrogenase complex dihydrolipoamide dehydrogenase (E3) component